VVNVTTKPGTNNWHGTAWEFNRLSAYTANTYNNVVNDLPKGAYTRNQFGFQVGGPIIKNKLFVSESTEFTRVRSNSVQTAEILDPSFIFGNPATGYPGLPANTQAYFKAFGATTVPSVEGGRMSGAEFKVASEKFSQALTGRLREAGYPAKADSARINYPMVLLLLVLLVSYVTLVYGPIAAWLVELFPARIRYTSMSLPYHIGNGWFGGFLPAVSFALVALTGDIYYGLWYPIIVALMTFVIGTLFLPETRNRHIR